MTTLNPLEMREVAIRKQFVKLVAGWYTFAGREHNWNVVRIKPGQWRVFHDNTSVYVEALGDAALVIAMYDNVQPEN